MPQEPARLIQVAGFTRSPPRRHNALAIVRVYGVEPTEAAHLIPRLSGVRAPHRLRFDERTLRVRRPGDVGDDRNQRTEAFFALAQREVGAFDGVDVLHDDASTDDEARLASQRRGCHAGPVLPAVVVDEGHLGLQTGGLPTQRAPRRPIVKGERIAVLIEPLPAHHALRVERRNRFRRKSVHARIADHESAIQVDGAGAEGQLGQERRQVLFALAKRFVGLVAFDVVRCLARENVQEPEFAFGGSMGLAVVGREHTEHSPRATDERRRLNRARARLEHDIQRGRAREQGAVLDVLDDDALRGFSRRATRGFAVVDRVEEFEERALETALRDNFQNTVFVQLDATHVGRCHVDAGVEDLVQKGDGIALAHQQRADLVHACCGLEIRAQLGVQRRDGRFGFLAGRNVHDHVDAADDVAGFVAQRRRVRLQPKTGAIGPLGDDLLSSNQLAGLECNRHRALVVRQRRSVGPKQLPRHAPTIAAELGCASRYFDCRVIEVREASFGIGGVDGRGKRVDHLAKSALALAQRRGHSLLLADVARDLRRAHHVAPIIENRGNRQGDVHQTAVLATTDGFVVVDLFTATDAVEDAGLFVMSIGGNEHHHRLPDRFLGRVSEELFRAGIPTRDDAVDVLADDGVVRRIDDGG